MEEVVSQGKEHLDAQIGAALKTHGLLAFAAEQITDGKAETAGDSVDIQEADVPFTTFNASDICAIKATS